MCGRGSPYSRDTSSAFWSLEALHRLPSFLVTWTVGQLEVCASASCVQHWVYGPCPRTLRIIEFPDVCYFASSKPRTATRNVSAMDNSDHDRLSDHATSIRKRSLDTRIFSPHCNQSVSEMTYYCHKRANYSSSTNPRSTSDRRSTIEIDIGARRSAATIMSPAILRTIGIRILYTICLRTFRRDICCEDASTVCTFRERLICWSSLLRRRLPHLIVTNSCPTIELVHELRCNTTWQHDDFIAPEDWHAPEQ